MLVRETKCYCQRRLSWVKCPCTMEKKSRTKLLNLPTAAHSDSVLGATVTPPLAHWHCYCHSSAVKHWDPLPSLSQVTQHHLYLNLRSRDTSRSCALLAAAAVESSCFFCHPSTHSFSTVTVFASLGINVAPKIFTDFW